MCTSDARAKLKSGGRRVTQRAYRIREKAQLGMLRMKTRVAKWSILVEPASNKNTLHF